MKILDIIKDANANLLRNKLRSFLTILAIFIGSFSIISTSAIQAGVNDFIDSQVDSYGGDGYLAIVSKDSFDLILDNICWKKESLKKFFLLINSILESS